MLSRQNIIKFSGQETETVRSSETLLQVHKFIRRHNPEYGENKRNIAKGKFQVPNTEGNRPNFCLSLFPASYISGPPGHLWQS
jgi:hypothetical protein